MFWFATCGVTRTWRHLKQRDSVMAGRWLGHLSHPAGSPRHCNRGHHEIANTNSNLVHFLLTTKNVWMSDKSWTFTTFTLSFTLSLSTCWTTFVFYAQKRLFIAENCNTFFGTSSAAASPYPVSLEFIELIPSKKLKMYFYSLHYLIAALKSKLGMNLFESVPENSFLSKTSNC